MEKRDKSLLDLEKKIDNYNEKKNVLNNFRFNKPDININNLNNKFNKDNLLSFLNNFKKENDKIMNEPDKRKYNIEENDEQDDEESDSNNNENNKDIKLDENEEENLDEKKNDKTAKKVKKDKNEQIELDLLMGILEQQKKKEITINNIIGNKRDNLKNEEKGEEEIINFLIEKKK